MSAGAAMKVALDEARSLGRGTVVALLPDGGERYLSTSLFACETVPEPLRFYNTLPGKMEQLQPVSPGKVTHLFLRAEPRRAARLGTLPPGRLCRRAAAISRISRLSSQPRHEPGRHRRPHGQRMPKSGENLRAFTARWEKVFFQSLDTPARQASAPLSPGQRARRRHGRADPQPAGKGPGLRETPLGLLPDRQFSRLWQAVGNRAAARCGARPPTTYDYYEKDHPGDFALFKRPTLAELKAGIFWPTPWGNARPGWHVECACMAVQCLGQPIDIHTASTDLTFPHGDNEIAIAHGLQDKPLAKLWMHSEVVMAEGKKVSRAAGNDLTLEQLLQQGFHGATVRYWLLATHYRTVLHYSVGELERAATCVSRLNEFVARLGSFTSGQQSPELDQARHSARAGWQEAMDNDLNLPKALGRLFAFIRHVNRLLNNGELDADQVRQVLDFMRQVNGVLDVIDFKRAEPDAQVARLVEERDAARRAKDFQRPTPCVTSYRRWAFN